MLEMPKIMPMFMIIAQHISFCNKDVVLSKETKNNLTFWNVWQSAAFVLHFEIVCSGNLLLSEVKVVQHEDKSRPGQGCKMITTVFVCNWHSNAFAIKAWPDYKVLEKRSKAKEKLIT